MLARGIAASSLGRWGSDVGGAQIIEVSDDRRSQRFHRSHGSDALTPPRIHRSQAVRHCGRSNIRRDSAARQLARAWPRGCEGSGGRPVEDFDTALVRNRRPVAEDLHGKVPHCLKAVGQADQIVAAQSANLRYASLRTPAIAAGKSTSFK